MRLVLGVAFGLLTGCLVPVDLSEADGGSGGGGGDATGGGGGTAVSDAGLPEDAGADAGVDAGVEDAGAEDAGVEDAGADAGHQDAGDDAGMEDAGTDDDAGTVVDAGSEEDAGEVDAGALDAGPADSLSLAVSAELPGGVELVWDAGSLNATSFIVRRDGVVIAMLPGSVREFFDLDAGAGLLATVDAGASRGLPDGIELTWNLRSSRGPTSTYEVSSQSLTSNAVTASRADPTLIGWLITRIDGGTEMLDASTRLWRDVEAMLPTAGATPGISARADDFTSAVMLSTDASVTAVDAEYSIEPLTLDGFASGETQSGARGGNPVLQWQRSTDDSPSTFVDLPMVHGLWWFDAEAVFNEGRFYRLVVKSGSVITGVSAPARALLWRPRFFAASQNLCILRDDDVALCGYRNSLSGTTPLRDVVTFTTDESHACGLHPDGGVSCIINNVEQQIALPAVSELIGHSRLCGRSASGWVCTAANPPVSAFSEVFTTSHWGAVCGRLIADGGVTCLSTTLGTAEFGAAELVGVSTDQACVMSDGGVQCQVFGGGARSVSLPSSPVPFTDLTVSNSFSGFCVKQSDGFVRCKGGSSSGYTWWQNPPLSSEPFEQFILSPEQSERFGCGLTPDHRLRCGGDAFRQLPPTQPVRQVELAYGVQGAYFLLENGRVAGRGRIQTLDGPAPEDRFVQLATVQSNGRICGLRADGSTFCWNGPPSEQPAAGKRYSAIGVGNNSSCGLELDGSISCWRGGWVPTGTFAGLMEINGGLCGQRADLSLSCEGMPFPAPPTGSAFTKVAAGSTNACGIRTDGYLECWPTAAPPQTVGRKYRDIAASPSGPPMCAVGLDGTTHCWGGNVPSPVWTDLISVAVGHEHACGVRADRTATCWGSPLFQWNFDP